MISLTLLSTHILNFKIIRLIIIIICILIPSMIMFINLSLASSTLNKSDEKGLYFYNNRELIKFLNNLGYPNFWGKSPEIVIYRNSKGSALRFLSEINRKAVIVSFNGSIQEIDLPGFPVWFNDENHIVAWHDRAKGMVHYKNGEVEKIPFRPISGPDPSGKYFIKKPPDLPPLPLRFACSTEIYSIDKPFLPLTKVNLCGNRKLFFKKEKIILFGNDYNADENKIDVHMSIHIFQNEGKGLIEMELLKINPPSESPPGQIIVDISPWDDEVLILDQHDLPSRPVWYVLKLKSKEMQKIGKEPYSGGYAFYLQCDIIKKVTEEQKKKKDHNSN